LYKAERTVAADRVRPFGTTLEVWAYLERIERDRWFKRHHGIKHFRLTATNRGRVGRATHGGTHITLPPWTRYPLYILHEVAHTVSPHGVPPHGWEYAAIYLRLVRHFLGCAAHDELRRAFKAHRVRYTRPRRLSPEARAAAVARLAAYRQAAA
jgi:hypothetical protein